MPRLRANARVMAFTVAVAALAATNAVVVPLKLEAGVLRLPVTPAVQYLGRSVEWPLPPAEALSGNGTDALAAAAVSQSVLWFETLVSHPSWAAGAAETNGTLDSLLRPRLAAFSAAGCASAAPLAAAYRKHASELAKMQDAGHVALIPLVESALAVMRLSCEKFFVLVSMYTAYLAFRHPPRPARALIRLNAHISAAFQRVILYSFPAVCWIYGAGACERRGWVAILEGLLTPFVCSCTHLGTRCEPWRARQHHSNACALDRSLLGALLRLFGLRLKGSCVHVRSATSDLQTTPCLHMHVIAANLSAADL